MQCMQWFHHSYHQLEFSLATTSPNSYPSLETCPYRKGFHAQVKKQPVLAAQEFPSWFAGLFLLAILIGDWSWVDQLIGSLSMASPLQNTNYMVFGITHNTFLVVQDWNAINRTNTCRFWTNDCVSFLLLTYSTLLSFGSDVPSMSIWQDLDHGGRVAPILCLVLKMSA